MCSRPSTLAVFAVIVFSQLTAAQEFDRILLPVVTAPAAGAFGSIWKTSLVAYNGSDTDALFEYPYPCVLATCVPWVFVPAHTIDPDIEQISAPPAATPGLLVYVTRPESAAFTFNLRVQDLSQQSLTWGTELPAVRASAAHTGATALLNIPTDGRFRLLLRVYDFDSRPQSIVHVRVLPMTSDVPLTELDLTLVCAFSESGGRQYHPGYASIANIAELPGVASQQQVRIELLPVTEGLRYWAFVTVTNNGTQHVTTITPQ